MPDQATMHPGLLAGTYFYEPGIEIRTYSHFLPQYVDGRRGQLIRPIRRTNDADDWSLWWVLWYDHQRAPLHHTIERIEPGSGWQFFADRDAWLTATAHLDHARQPEPG